MSVGDGGASVAISRLLQKSTFGPEDKMRMCEAYELALQHLELKDRDDPLTETIAKYIVEATQTGAKEPEIICHQALILLRRGRKAW
jgi:hypothetical protein